MFAILNKNYTFTSASILILNVELSSFTSKIKKVAMSHLDMNRKPFSIPGKTKK